MQSAGGDSRLRVTAGRELVMRHDTKLIGDISERIASLALLKLGFNVLEPVGDRLPYDLAVDVCGRLIRLQVKTASYSKDEDCFMGETRLSRTNRAVYLKRKVDTDNADFFIYVVQSTQVCYVIPAEIIRRVKSRVALMPHRPRRVDRQQLEQYREKWDLLNNFAGGLGLGRVS